MPKQKSNRAAAKRFKATASGRVKHKRSFARHILTSKDRARKRRLRKPGYVSAADERRIKRLMNLA